MKKLLFTIASLGIGMMLQAQVSLTINETTPGTLSTLLTANQLDSVTNLTITGTIDARDFVMWSIQKLAVLDLSEATIVPYTGNSGPYSDSFYFVYLDTVFQYPANTIPKYAFFSETLTPYSLDSKTSLTSIIFPENLTSIGDSAFNECTGLTTINIPSSVTSIGEGAFDNCKSLTSVALPSSVKSIGDYAFSGCKSLTSINIPSLVDTLSFRTFEGCTSLVSINIPSSVKSIGGFCFQGCTSLTSISIPSSVTFIDSRVFQGCNSLKSVYEYSTIPVDFLYDNGSSYGEINWPSDYFPGFSCILYVPAGSKAAYQAAPTWKNFYLIVEMGSSDSIAVATQTITTEIATAQQDVQDAISGVAVGEYPQTTITALNNQITIALNARNADTSTTAPATLATLASLDSAISALTAVLTSFTNAIITASPITTINVVTPGTLSTLLTTKDLNTITTLSITGTIDARDFEIMRDSMPSITTIDLSGATIVAYTGTKGTLMNDSTAYSANSIPQHALYDKEKLTSISMPSSVTSIGDAAFSDCQSLPSVTIPPSVTYIGAEAFYYCGGLTSINIPASVTSIGDAAFWNCSGFISTITIPSSVTSIGDHAFCFCRYLTSIIIPSSVTSIGAEAFYDCASLTSLYAYERIPVNLSSSPSCFSYIDTATCILYVPAGSKAEYDTASQWKAFTHIVEMGVTSTSGITTVVTDSAGSLATKLNATQLDTITHLTLVGNIDARDFEIMRDSMPSLISLDLSEATIVAYTGTKGTLMYDSTAYSANSIPQEALDYKEKLTSISMPSSVISIGDDAFKFCDSLTTISIPSSVTSIGVAAFWNSGLTSVTIPSSVNYIGGATFSACKNLTSATIQSSGSIGAGTFCSCVNLKTVTFTSSIDSIGKMCFYGCSSLQSINIPSSVTYIGPIAFSYCNFTSFTFPSSIKYFGSIFGMESSGSFGTIVTVPDTTLKSIYSFASEPIDLSSTHAFESVDTTTCILYVPAGSKAEYDTASQWKAFTHIVEMGVTSTSGITTVVTDSAGSLATKLNATQLDTITHLTLIGNIDARDFEIMRDSMPDLTTIDLSGATIVAYTGTKGTLMNDSTAYSANSIPQDALYDKEKLTSISMPSSVISIGDDAFEFCDSLTTISIPSSVTSIGGAAFYNCSGLTSVSISASVTSIGTGAFSGCASLKSVSIPISSSVTSIGDEAFTNCKDLTSINIPASVTSIREGAFAGCSSLTSIYTYASTPINLAFAYQWDLTATPIDIFENVDTTTCILYVPAGSKAEYDTASQWKAFTHIVEMGSDTTNTITATTCGSYTLNGTMYTTSGTFTQTGITVAGGDSVITLHLTVNPLPTVAISAQPDSILTGANTVLLASGGSSYSWSNGVATPSQTVSPTATTTYSVTGTDANGCSATTSIKVTVQAAGTGTTAVASVGNDDFALYPNPATASFSINTTEYVQVQVYTMNGTLVISKQLSGKEPIATNGLPAGLYVVKIVTATVVVVRNLVVE